ncbi:MAG: histidine kinase, partial [Candidatus Calescibacterium sp.]|nr:histidine kinase [Candidatus Calescibacterium sp.]
LLSNHEQTLVTLETELDFIQSYVQLLKTRFSDALQIEISVPEDLKKMKVVPVTLQVLIENALKHNMATVRSPLFIHIFCEGDYLIVQNNIQRKAVVPNSHQRGLAQLRSLYSYICEKPLLITDTGKLFIVKIPLVFATKHMLQT